MSEVPSVPKPLWAEVVKRGTQQCNAATTPNLDLNLVYDWVLAQHMKETLEKLCVGCVAVPPVAVVRPNNTREPCFFFARKCCKYGAKRCWRDHTRKLCRKFVTTGKCSRGAMCGYVKYIYFLWLILHVSDSNIFESPVGVFKNMGYVFMKILPGTRVSENMFQLKGCNFV